MMLLPATSAVLSPFSGTVGRDGPPGKSRKGGTAVREEH